MTDSSEIRDLLIEIRDNQRLSLQRQEEHLAIAREQIERSRNQVQESIELQRQAVARVKRISRIAVPGIVVCLLLIVYLLVRYSRYF
jgi:t-SNARE complex subunit (syntaxin)